MENHKVHMGMARREITLKKQQNKQQESNIKGSQPLHSAQFLTRSILLTIPAASVAFVAC